MLNRLHGLNIKEFIVCFHVVVPEASQMLCFCKSFICFWVEEEKCLWRSHLTQLTMSALFSVIWLAVN